MPIEQLILIKEFTKFEISQSKVTNPNIVGKQAHVGV